MKCKEIETYSTSFTGIIYLINLNKNPVENLIKYRNDWKFTNKLFRIKLGRNASSFFSTYSHMLCPHRGLQSLWLSWCILYFSHPWFQISKSKLFFMIFRPKNHIHIKIELLTTVPPQLCLLQLGIFTQFNFQPHYS